MTVSTPTKPQTQETDLIVVSNLRDGLVMARCQEIKADEELKRAIRDAHDQLGASVENLSEASGLRIEVVEDLLRSEDRSEENLAILAGLN